MAWKKILAAAVLASVLPLAGAAEDRGDEVVHVSNSDATMNAAIKEARRTLPDFLKLAANPPADTEGYKLKVKIVDGPRVERRAGELASEGMVLGALQVPPSGEPVLFLADHPVTGGYPVIAVVVPEDLPLAAQLPPGARVRFTLHH